MLISLVVALASTVPELPPAPPLAESVPGRLRAVGAEPFWDVTVDPTYGFIFTDLGGETGQQFAFDAAAPTTSGDGYEFKSGRLTLRVTEEACSDGMSDNVYPYTARATVEGGRVPEYKGCAYQPWGVRILAALPAIDACLAVAGETRDETVVVYAAGLGDGGGYVLLRTFNDSPLRACTVTKGEAEIAPFEGENLPIGTDFDLFVRAPGENPGGECYDAPEVLGADGKPVGWWLDPMGC